MVTQQINLKGIADAIREKDGTTALIPAETFKARIRAIPTSGEIVPTPTTGWRSRWYWSDDELMPINIFDGSEYKKENLPENTIRILVDTRFGHKTFAFQVASAEGYTQKIYYGKDKTFFEEKVFGNWSISQITFTEDFPENYAVFEFTSSSSIDRFAVTKHSLMKSPQNHAILWAAIRAEIIDTANMFYKHVVPFVICKMALSVHLYSNALTVLGAYTFAYMEEMCNLEYPSQVEVLATYALSNTGLFTVYVSPSVWDIGINGLSANNRATQTAGCQGVKRVGHQCCAGNKLIQSYSFPALESSGNTFFNDNQSVKSIYIGPNFKITSSSLFANCASLVELICYSAFDTSQLLASCLNGAELLKLVDLRYWKSSQFHMKGSAIVPLQIGKDEDPNVEGFNSPLALDFAGSIWGATSPHIDISYGSWSANKLNGLFTDIVKGNFANKTIVITGNPGAATCDKSIITAAGGAAPG